MMARTAFHGSYSPSDCEFLLEPIDKKHAFVSITEKERRIQSGESHYSEMLHRESEPSAAYMNLFDELCERNGRRMAAEIRGLARQLVAEVGVSDRPVVLVSLVRAGTPVGALLRRAMTRFLWQPAVHYSISIIRDRGIDIAALNYIIEHLGHDPDRIVFVDAWTAKGVITSTLRQAIEEYNRTRNLAGKPLVPCRLAVLSDIGGTADFAATCDDYAIPSGVLNASASGLVSRSIRSTAASADQFDGCVYYDDMAAIDRSRSFLDRISRQMPRNAALAGITTDRLVEQKQLMDDLMARLMAEFGIDDINLIKPGIAEATRVMLRRIPELLIVRDDSAGDVAHLVHLAHQKNIPVDVQPSMAIEAVALIQRLAPKEPRS